jgi:hypothetical protein
MNATSSTFVDFTILTLASGILCGCSQNQDQVQNDAKNHDAATLHDLAVKYSATSDWQKTLTNKTSAFTIDVQDALVHKAAPLELSGNLVDVRREGDHIVAVFDVSITASFSLSLCLICSEEQRAILTDKRTSYAIIANIHKVVKQGALNVVGASSGENGELEDAAFDVDWDTETYWVTGNCLDLKKLGE